MVTGGLSIFLGDKNALAALLYLYHYNPRVPVDELSAGTGLSPKEISELLNLAIKFNVAEITPSGEVNLTDRGEFVVKSILQEAGAPTARTLE